MQNGIERFGTLHLNHGVEQRFQGHLGRHAFRFRFSPDDSVIVTRPRFFENREGFFIDRLRHGLANNVGDCPQSFLPLLLFGMARQMRQPEKKFLPGASV